MAGHHGVENDAQRKNIRTAIHAFAAELFGSHICGRAHHLTRKGQLAQIQLGDAEVGNLGVSVFGDQDVRRLDVTVDYALRVRIVERLGQFFGELERVGKRQFLFTDKNLVQGFAGNEFENNIRTLIVRVLPDVKDATGALRHALELSGSCPRMENVFTATCRSICGSRALYTTPMAPRPSSAKIS